MQQRPDRSQNQRKHTSVCLFSPRSSDGSQTCVPLEGSASAVWTAQGWPGAVEGADWYGGSMGQAASQCPHLTSCQTLGSSVYSKTQFSSSVKWEQLIVAQWNKTC